MLSSSALSVLDFFLNGACMKFAKVLFYIAGIWGILVLTPLFFIFCQEASL